MSLLALVLSCSLLAEAVDHPEHGARIDAIVAEAMKQQPIPGISVAVLRKGELAHAKGYGFADLENEVRMAPDSVCRIASVTKQFTAAAVMKLVEQGKVSLDDPLSKYVSGFGDIGDEATIRQILHHTSGIADFTRLGKEWNEVEQLDLTPDRVMDLVRKRPPEFAPGTKWAYDNTGYVLLGMVIEKASGKSYADFLEHDLLGSAGLADTRYGDDARIMKRRAEGYRNVDGVVMNDPLKSMTHPYAAGAIVSTAVDLVRWSDLLARGRIVSAESYAAMTTPGSLANGDPIRYGLGIRVGEFRGKRTVWHDGGIHGFVSHLAHYVEADIHVAVLANCDFADAPGIGEQIARMFLGVVEEVVKDLPLTDEEIDACTGKYEGAGMTVLIRRDGEKLMLMPKGQTPGRLRSQGGLRFVPDFDDEVALTFDGAKDPAPFFVLEQHKAKVKFTRVD